MIYLPLTSAPLGLPFTLNRTSPQARGLVSWWPAVTQRPPMIASGPMGQPVPLITGTNTGIGIDPVAGQGLSFAAGTGKAAATGHGGLPTAAAAAWTIAVTVKGGAYVALAQLFGFGVALPGSGAGGLNRYILSYLNNYYFWGGSADWDTGIAYDTTGIHYIAFVSDGTSMFFYRDGVQRATTARPALGVANTVITAGAGHPSAASSSNATIYDARIYNRALSAAEVWRLYAPQTRWELYGVPVARGKASGRALWPVVGPGMVGGGAIVGRAA